MNRTQDQNALNWYAQIQKLLGNSNLESRYLYHVHNICYRDGNGAGLGRGTPPPSPAPLPTNSPDRRPVPRLPLPLPPRVNKIVLAGLIKFYYS